MEPITRISFNDLHGSVARRTGSPQRSREIKKRNHPLVTKMGGKKKKKAKTLFLSLKVNMLLKIVP